MNCKYVNASKGVSFDLSAIADTQSFMLQDRLQTSQQDYIYTFGICTAVEPPANCKTSDGKSRVRHYYSPAWQTRAGESIDTASSVNELDCKYLGSPDDQWHSWAIDEEDPASGVTLTYANGQSCSHKDPVSGAKIRREFAIRFRCAAHTERVIDEEVIDESAHCKYEIEIESEYACPMECGLDASGAICGGHGICGYDTDALRARCYCNRGRGGEHCTEEEGDDEGGQSSGPIVALLVIIVLGVIAVIGLLVYLLKYMNNRKAVIMGDIYSSLHSDLQERSFDLEQRGDFNPPAPVMDSNFGEFNQNHAPSQM